MKILRGIVATSSIALIFWKNSFQLSSRCETHSENSMDEQKKLIFATVYFRHGTRTRLSPLKYFPHIEWGKEMCNVDNSQSYLPYKILNLYNGNEERPASYYDNLYNSMKLPGGCAAGQLTIKGQQLSYNLGKTLKDRYLGRFELLNEQYKPDLVGAYSTNVDRTIQSMQATLKGLFEDSINDENVAVVHTRPNEIDYVLTNRPFCEKIDKWMGYAYSAQYSLRVCDTLREKLAQMFNNSNDIPQPIDLWDSLVSMKSNGFKLPQHYEEIYDLVEKCAVHAEKYAVYSDTTAMMKILFGKVIDDIIIHLEKAAKHHDKVDGCDKDYYRLWLNCCHDTTILTLISAMGGFDEKWPPLASYIAFELFRDASDKNFYVRVVYNGEIIKSGGCDSDGFMKLDEFVKKHAKIRLEVFDKDHFYPYPPLN